MYTKTVISAFGTFFIFVTDVTFCSELYQFIELESYKNTVGNVDTIEKFDLKKNPFMCWRICHRHLQCTSYFENNGSKKCYIAFNHLSEEQVEEEDGWKYFVKKPQTIQLGTSCPTQLGYTFDDGSKLCIKLLTEGKMYRPHAVGNCTEDGGRLLQIKDENQQEGLANYLQRFYPHISPMIDGERPDNNGIWSFENGEVLSFFKWTDNEPGLNKKCIRVSKGFNYYWISAYCSLKNHHMCEIPLDGN